MNAKKCDLCKKFYEYGETIGGSVASHTLGRLLHYYPVPRVYDLCTNCARPVEDAVKNAVAHLRKDCLGTLGDAN